MTSDNTIDTQGASATPKLAKQPSVSKSLTCLSTHGDAGYAPGSILNPDGTITCGWCGIAIQNPPTVGSYKGRPNYGVAVTDLATKSEEPK